MNRLWVALLGGAAAAHASAADFVTVGFQSPELAKASLKRLVDSVGSIYRVNAGADTYTIRLKSGQSATRIAKLWKGEAGVIVARVSQPDLDFTATNFNSVKGLTATIAELTAQNDDLIAMRKARGMAEPDKTEKVKTSYYESYKYWLEERAYPRDTIDWRAFQKAAAWREQMQPAGGGLDGYSAGNWQFIGPTNLDVPYTTYYGVRPTSGRVNALAVDPSNPNVIYMGGANGGVWKTTNGGTNWVPLTDGWTWLSVSSLAIDPSNTQVIYAGTGDFPGSRIYTQGMMKSTDGGASWTQIGGSTFGSRAINSIVIDPENPQIVVACSGRGASGNRHVFRSTNGGSTWTSVLTTDVNWAQLSIGALSAGSRIYYVSGGGTGGNVWRSLDRGITWTKLTTPAVAATNHSVIQVAASPIFPNTVYIMVNADQKIYKSVDAGLTWTNVTTGLPQSGNTYYFSQSTYNWFLTVSSASTPSPRDIIYAGFICVEMSPDGGATWRTIGGPTYSTSAKTHNDQHTITVDPSNPNRVIVGNDGGAYTFTLNPSTNTGTWTYLSQNLGITQFYKMAIHPTNPDHLMGGTQDNATPHSLGNLANWDNVGGGDGGFCDIHPTTPNTQYATSQNLNIYRTTNAWASSSGISPSTSDPKAFIAPIVLDYNNPHLLYAGTNYLNVRNNTTATWSLRLGNQVLTTGTVRYIAVAPGDGNVIYTGGSDGQVWMTRNAGSTWTQINTGSTSLPARTITSISINPADKNDVLITVSGTGSGHVWRCADTTAATRVWQNRNGSGLGTLPDNPGNAIVRDPVDFDNVWWVGMDLGVFVTEDGGATWQNATQPLGLPNVQVNDFRASATTNYLTAATFGRGFWRLPLPKVVYATSFNVVSGSLLVGGLNELKISDNQVMGIGNDTFAPNTIVEFTTTSPDQNLTEVQFVYEGKGTRDSHVRIIELWDYVSGSWVNVQSGASSTTEVRLIATVTNNPSRFVQAGTKQMRARLRFVPTQDLTAVDGWNVQIDRAFWRVTP